MDACHSGTTPTSPASLPEMQKCNRTSSQRPLVRRVASGEVQPLTRLIVLTASTVTIPAVMAMLIVSTMASS